MLRPLAGVFLRSLLSPSIDVKGKTTPCLNHVVRLGSVVIYLLGRVVVGRSFGETSCTQVVTTVPSCSESSL